MSKRAVKYWAVEKDGREGIEIAYPKTGSKCKAGELFYVDVYKKLGYKTSRPKDDFFQQKSGIDIILKKDKSVYTIDVKNNMTPSKDIFIEHLSDGWLFNKKSDYICHVNPDLGILATYTREQMKAFITDYIKTRVIKPSKKGFYLKYRDIPSFVKWRCV